MPTQRNNLRSVSQDNRPKHTDKDRVVIPATLIPGFRTALAVDNGVEKNLLFRTWGGLGDQICAEPTLRFALKSFPDCTISLTSEKPELFSHLKFAKVFDETQVKPIFDKYLLLETITPPDDSNLVWQFFSHMLVNCVDFPSLCALRCQLPVEDREIYLSGKCPENLSLNFDNSVFIHPGRHWPTKTFPKDWWDETIQEISRRKLTPVLIGADSDDNRGTVDVDPSFCVDLRGGLSVRETIWCLQRAEVLLTNDSAPLHMAASTDPDEPHETGHCAINYLATVKHPDFITHWRKGEWQYKEYNLAKGGMWQITNQCPNTDKKVLVDKVEEELLRSWLPEPREIASKVSDCF